MSFESKKRDRDEFGPVSRGEVHLVDGLILGEKPDSPLRDFGVFSQGAEECVHSIKITGRQE